MSEASSPKRVTRRTVAKGAAWTVPAIAVATPAAAVANSMPPVTPDIPNALGCKWPGGAADCTDPLDKGFRIYIPFDNNTGYNVTVTVSDADVTSGGTCSRDYQWWEAGPAASDGIFNIAVGGSADFWVTWHDDNSGNNKTMSVKYTYTITSGPNAGQIFGPYTIPVSKEFNTNCAGAPEPTIATGPCTVPPSESSNCP